MPRFARKTIQEQQQTIAAADYRVPHRLLGNRRPLRHRWVVPNGQPQQSRLRAFRQLSPVSIFVQRGAKTPRDNSDHSMNFYDLLRYEQHTLKRHLISAQTNRCREFFSRHGPRVGVLSTDRADGEPNNKCRDHGKAD
jgi:hypothetical protein